MHSKPKSVQTITVKKLFNLYTHNIDLKEDGITIIHGQNGVGKTVILSILDAFFNGNWNFLIKYPYKQLDISFTDNSMLSITQSNISVEDKKINFVYNEHKTTIKSSTLNPERIAHKIERETPYLDQIGPDTWIDMRTKQTFTAWEIVSIYGKTADVNQILPNGSEWLIDLKDSVHVSFIKTQRLELGGNSQRAWPLRRLNRERSSSVVNIYAEKMKEIHTAALSDYGKVSQNLDQTFPNRLLQPNVHTLEKQELKQKMDAIEEKRNKLKEIKVLEKDHSEFSYASLSLDNLSSTHYQVLSTYVEDSEKKLKTLEGISKRVDLMLNKINEKFQHKKISLDSEYGLVLYGYSGNRLNLSDLSSGEQHELVLIFDLLFNTDENTLILIDEPELSLHISWQRKFLDDLKDIIALNNVSVIVATHSPNIIEGYDDLMVELQS
jgi:predicted ATP-binding protein involved in virulence